MSPQVLMGLSTFIIPSYAAPGYAAMFKDYGPVPIASSLAQELAKVPQSHFSGTVSGHFAPSPNGGVLSRIPAANFKVYSTSADNVLLAHFDRFEVAGELRSGQQPQNNAVGTTLQAENRSGSANQAIPAGTSQAQNNAAETSHNWLVQQPYGKQNPLKRAALIGLADYSGHSAKAALLVECHPESGTAKIGIRISEIGFDVGSFDGEDGVGTQKKLFRFAVGDNPAASRNVNGGGQSANTFQFDFNPSKAELSQLVSPSAPGKPVVATIQPPSGKGAPLMVRFLIPVNNAPLATVTAPCLAHP